MRNHTLNLLLSETTPINPIIAQLIKEGFFLKTVLNIMEELLLLVGGQVMWHDP